VAKADGQWVVRPVLLSNYCLICTQESHIINAMPRVKPDPVETELRRRIALVQYRATEGIRTVQSSVESVLDRAVGEHSLPLSTRRRGRPLRAKHPLPRREPKWDERGRLDSAAHEKHQGEYVIGCHGCYLREYIYFRNHPDERPLLDQRKKRRPWIDKGWEKDYQDVPTVPRVEKPVKLPRSRMSKRGKW